MLLHRIFLISVTSRGSAGNATNSTVEVTSQPLYYGRMDAWITSLIVGIMVVHTQEFTSMSQVSIGGMHTLLAICILKLATPDIKIITLDHALAVV